jgi:hypothetical protein
VADRKSVNQTYIGTAAWANPPAERSARAAGESHLEHYASRFNAVEINSSFYRPHQRSTYARWAQVTPARFRFSVKAPRSITHEAGLRHCRAELRQFLEEITGLGQKLGVILVQTPAVLEFETRLAARFFAALAASDSSRIACRAAPSQLVHAPGGSPVGSIRHSARRGRSRQNPGLRHSRRIPAAGLLPVARLSKDVLLRLYRGFCAELEHKSKGGACRFPAGLVHL